MTGRKRALRTARQRSISAPLCEGRGARFASYRRLKTGGYRAYSSDQIVRIQGFGKLFVREGIKLISEDDPLLRSKVTVYRRGRDTAAAAISSTLTCPLCRGSSYMRLSEQARFAGLWRCGDHPVTPSGRAYSARLCFLLEAHYWSSCSWSRNTEPAFCRPRGGSPALAQRSTGASLYWSPGCPPPAVSKLERIEGIQLAGHNMLPTDL